VSAEETVVLMFWFMMQDKIWDVFAEVMRSDEELQTSTEKPDPEQSM